MPTSYLPGLDFRIWEIEIFKFHGPGIDAIPGLKIETWGTRSSEMGFAAFRESGIGAIPAPAV
jgi:hypothetical protein